MTTIKAGEKVAVINPRTGKAMSGTFTFRAHVVTPESEWVEVYQEAREIVRAFPTDRIRPLT